MLLFWCGNVYRERLMKVSFIERALTEDGVYDAAFVQHLQNEWQEQVTAACKNVTDFTEIPPLKPDLFTFCLDLKLQASVELGEDVLAND